MGVRPSFGLFLRHLKDSTFQDIALKFAQNDDRPSMVLIDCSNITVTNATLNRGQNVDYDIGVCDSALLHVTDSHIKLCSTFPVCT